MRITTNSIMRQYSGRLNTVLSNLNVASDRVSTGRNYTKASEDPASSAISNQLRREFLNNEMFTTNLENVQSRMVSVESTIMNVTKVSEDAYADLISAMNETKTSAERSIIADKLREMQATMVKELNVTEAGDYIFGGTNTKEAPFELTEDNKLLYRGIDVTNGDIAVLDELAAQEINVDLGFGIATDATGEIDSNTAFNMATPGINFLGYGVNTNGTSKNLIVLLGETAEMLESADYSHDEASIYLDELDAQRDDLVIELTKLGSNTMFLDYTQNRLEDSQYNYNEKIYNLEYMDPALAITELTTQQYIYNATLKVGSGILSPSFIDFMT